MILLDWRGYVIPQIHGYAKFINGREFKLEVFEQSILKSIGLLNREYSRKYGELVICCDCRGKDYWRKKIFPHYKAGRSAKQIESTFRDPVVREQMYKLPVQLAEKIKENFPFKVLTVKGAEADDIIGALVYANTDKKHLIVSRDGDFKQLQRFDVDQIEGNTRKKVVSLRPLDELEDKIMSGDSGDGIPNILSPEDCLVTGVRQTQLRKDKKAYFAELDELPKKIQERYDMNKKLIDLSQTPVKLCNQIIREFEEQTPIDSAVVLNSIIKLRYANLINESHLFQ